MSGKGRISLLVLGAAALTVLVVLYGLYDPSDVKWFPKCPFLLLTGLKCPGCGSQRAVHALLHLDIAEALSYNPLLVLSIPFLVMLWTAVLCKERYPKFYNRMNSSGTAVGVLVVVIFWWILRNIIGC